jgi:hypothetical protein
MHIIYIDDSGDNQISIYSALAIPVEHWKTAFSQTLQYRSKLKKVHGIYVYKELHAWEFVSGRGSIANHVIPKQVRVNVFNETLDFMLTIPGIRLFNVAFPKSQQLQGFERLINRINRTLEKWNSQAILVCDQGNELALTRLIRRMTVYNPIPSSFGTWQDSRKSWKNIPIDRIIEDPFFKDSSQSRFIQMCDFAAYSLLRRENQLPSKNKYGLHQSFSRLLPICVHEVAPRDPDGIIRP